MTPARSLTVALLALAVLVGAQPGAGAQFPRGLLSAPDPRTPTRSCTIETRALNFGTYQPGDAGDLQAIGQIIYTCENAGLLSGIRAKPEQHGIRIELAQGSSNSFASRGMQGPESLVSGRRLDYNIYLDATRRQVWGTGEGPTLAYVDSNPPNRTQVIVPAFGSVFAGQDVLPGPYSDTVPVRILF